MKSASDNAPAPATKNRDLPLDFIRGFAMLLVVINHLPIPSHYYLLTVDRIGIVTGAELFVIISGFVLGMTHRSRIEQQGWRSSTRGLLKRALQIYVAILCVTIAIWFVNAFIVNLDILMQWTDPKSGKTYVAIPSSPLENPARNFQDLLRLRLTPPEINILGYFAVISALAPGALWLLHKQKTAALLVLSWTLYGVNFFQHWRVTPGIFENPFPLLSWQLPFVNALVLGYHRRELGAFLERAKLRHTLVAAAVTLVVCCIFFTWNNPWTNAFQYEKIPHWARLSMIPPDVFNLVYSKLFGDRTWLFLGRLFDAAAIIFVLYILLKKYWLFANRWFGWFFVPFGQASLYIFIMHLVIVAALTAPLAQNHRMLVNSALHSVALLTLWLMVKTRFLFKIVPR